MIEFNEFLRLFDFFPGEGRSRKSNFVEFFRLFYFSNWGGVKIVNFIDFFRIFDFSTRRWEGLNVRLFEFSIWGMV